jgi:hypothetical protein
MKYYKVLGTKRIWYKLRESAGRDCAWPRKHFVVTGLRSEIRIRDLWHTRNLVVEFSYPVWNSCCAFFTSLACLRSDFRVLCPSISTLEAAGLFLRATGGYSSAVDYSFLQSECQHGRRASLWTESDTSAV